MNRVGQSDREKSFKLEGVIGVNSRHAARQLLHSSAVIEGELPRCDGDITEAERQADRDKV